MKISIRQIINYIFRKSTVDEPVKDDYYSMLREVDRDIAIKLQEVENRKIEVGIKNEAKRWLDEYESTPTIKIGDTEFKPYIPIMRPFVYAIIIYDEATAKYKDCDIEQLVRDEYLILKMIRHNLRIELERLKKESNNINKNENIT